MSEILSDRPLTKEFISKAPSPSPSRGKGCNISPPLRGGDEGEGDACGFTNDRISNRDRNFLFRIFAVWTFVLLGRPQDILTFLEPIRPALLLGVVTLLAFILNMPSSGKGYFSNTQVKLYTALIIIMALSIPFALYARAAFMFLFTSYATVIIFFFIFYKVINSTGRLKQLLFITCLGSGLYSLAAMLGGGMISSRLFFGGMFDPNDLAFVTVSFLPLNLIFISSDNGLLKRYICAGNFVIGLILILSTGSRGGFIATSVVMLMLLFTKTLTFRRSYKFAFVGLILMILPFTMIDFDRYWGMTHLGEDYNVTSEEGRWQVWQTGVRLMLSDPLTGVGITCFGEAIATDRAKRDYQAKYQTAHNSLIQVGAETGVIGFILFAIISFNALRIFGRARKRARSAELVKMSEMARIGCAGHLAGCMFLSQAYSNYWAFYIVLSAVLFDLTAETTAN